LTDAELVREIAQPLSGGSDDYDALLALIGNARFVQIGEATHGTHEFYSERATITNGSSLKGRQLNRWSEPVFGKKANYPRPIHLESSKAVICSCSYSKKSDARRRAHSQSLRETEKASLMSFARSAFGVRCVVASLSSRN
jgi:hypothetical protein